MDHVVHLDAIIPNIRMINYIHCILEKIKCILYDKHTTLIFLLTGDRILYNSYVCKFHNFHRCKAFNPRGATVASVRAEFLIPNVN